MKASLWSAVKAAAIMDASMHREDLENTKTHT
jgi:hypothetical protein